MAQAEGWIRSMEALGLSVTWGEGRLRPQVISEITSFEDIKARHKGRDVRLLRKDKKWYMGWDIPDHLIKVILDGERWAFWSDSAHGGPLTNSAREGDAAAWAAYQMWVAS